MNSKVKSKPKENKASKPKKGPKSAADNKAPNADQSPKVEAEVPPKPIKSNPLPLITGLEVITPLAEGENKFISIVNGPPLRIPLIVLPTEENVQKPVEHEPSKSPDHQQQPEKPSPSRGPEGPKTLADDEQQQQQQPEFHLAITRVHQIENVLDDPHVAPEPITFYDGCSYDCYPRAGLDLLSELCESCKEIWRRWPIRLPPPPEIDPFEDFLCVGDIDKNFQPARGDIAIFNPYGPQSLAGLRTGRGFLATYRGLGDFKFYPSDLVVRLGSFSGPQLTSNVDYLPYEKVELRVMTNSREWRFLGGQVGNFPPKSAGTERTNVKPAIGDEKDAAGAKKGKKGGGAAAAARKKGKELQDPKTVKSVKQLSNKENSGNKKNGNAATSKKDKKGAGKKGATGKASDAGKEKQSGGVALPEFSLDDIPDVFNTIPKLPDPYVLHPGEKTIRSVLASMTCNYRYHKPGIHCGKGELEPQLGDIIIREPTAWLHDDWGNRIKRPKGSMMKWYKPAPWKRELKPGMMLLRPHIDRESRLDVVPQCPYSPTMRSQWGTVELFTFEGPEPPAQPREEVEQLSEMEGEAAGMSESAGNQKKDGKAGNKAVTKSEKRGGPGWKDDSEKRGAGDKGAKSSGPKGKQDSKKDTTGKPGKENAKKKKESPRDQKDDGAKTTTDELNRNDESMQQKKWTYWGRCPHIFDTPFQFGTLDEICVQRHQAETRKALDLQPQFFVEDSGAESDLEAHAKLLESAAISAAVKQDESKNKKGQKGGKGSEKTQTQTKGKTNSEKEMKAGKKK